VRYSKKQKRISDLSEEYGESIDNLPMDILMEAIYNERHAPNARLLHEHETNNQEKET
jgi:hypothetical protein